MSPDPRDLESQVPAGVTLSGKAALLSARTFLGANPWTSEPAVVAELDWQGLRFAPGLGERLQAAFPDLALTLPTEERTVAQAQGVLGNAIGRPAWWVAWWARALLESERGDIRAAGAAPAANGHWNVWVGWHDAALSRDALALGVQVVASFAGHEGAGTRAADGPALAAIQARCRRLHPDYQARILREGARALQVPVLEAGPPGSRLWQYGWGAASRLFFESRSNDDGGLGHELSSSKAASKDWLRRLGLPTPAHALVEDVSQLEAAAARIGWPCAVKPLDRGGGKGVTAGVTSPGQLQQAFAHARRFSEQAIMVEAFVAGDDHRLQVVDGRLAWVIRRDPPAAVGDGASTLRQLIDQLNQGRTRNLRASGYRRPVVVDEVVQARLLAQGLHIDSVPAAGRKVWLRSNGNLSTGGECTDLTAACHPDVAELAEALADSLQIANLGVDYLTTDISRSWLDGAGSVIEFNTNPGIDAAVVAGRSEQEVARIVLGHRPGRLPSVLVVMNDADQVQCLPRLRQAASLNAGLAWCCAGACAVGALTLRPEPGLLHARVTPLLRHRRARLLCIVANARELWASGLPLDHVDLALRVDPSLPQAWARTLSRQASRAIACQGVDEAWAQVVAQLQLS